MSELSDRLVEAAYDEIMEEAWASDAADFWSAAKKSVVVTLRELADYYAEPISDPRTDWGHGWCEHRSSTAINLRNMAKMIAEESE